MSIRNCLVVLMAVMVTCCAVPQVKGALVVVYEEDFSSDPGWTTNSSDRYYWDSSDQTYYANRINVNQGGYYTYKEVNYQGGNFRLQWDMMAISVNYATSLPFGMFDSTNIGVGYGGQRIKAYLTREDRGRTTAFQWVKGTDGEGLYSVKPQWSQNTWYTFAVEYDATANTLDLDIIVRDTSQAFTSIHLNDVAPLDAGMNRIGSASVRPTGTYQVPGAQAWGKFDNIVFSAEQSVIPEPSSLIVWSLIGLSFIGIGWRRRRKTT